MVEQFLIRESLSVSDSSPAVSDSKNVVSDSSFRAVSDSGFLIRALGVSDSRLRFLIRVSSSLR